MVLSRGIRVKLLEDCAESVVRSDEFGGYTGLVEVLEDHGDLIHFHAFSSQRQIENGSKCRKVMLENSVPMVAQS